MHIKAVIYARFSSDRQNEESIAAQHRACREYAQRNGIEIIGTYDDEAISGREGKTELRREYQKLLRDAQAKRFDAILIHKYDRVARSLNEHVTLEMRLKKWGVDLIAVAQDFGRSNEAKIMRAVIWSMSEYYSDNLADEVKKGHRETALQGKHNGGYAPFGYDVVAQRYIINELEAAYVRRIFEAAANREGFKDLIAEMQAAGITGKRGRPIKYPQIYEILRNEKYTGVYTYSPQEEESRRDRRSKPNAIRIENALPVIIGKAQFMEVQKIMEGRKQSGRKAGYLCSGLGYCQCGAKLHGFTSRRKGHEYKYYICSAHCGARMIHMEDMDAAVLGYLHDLLSEENQELIAKAMRTYEGSAKDRIEGFEAARKKKIKELQANYDALMKNLASSILPPEVVKDIGAQMETIKVQIFALENEEPPEDYSVDMVKEWLESIKAAPDEKAVHLLIERIDTVQEEEKTVFNITSTLKTVLEKMPCAPKKDIRQTCLFLLVFNGKTRFFSCSSALFEFARKRYQMASRFLLMSRI